MKKLIAILLILIALAIGFFIGRATIRNKEIVKYVKGETVNGTVYTSGIQVGERLKEFKTDLKELPIVYWRTDTVVRENRITQIVDTAKILEDFITKRQYELNLFDNLNGKLDVSPVIQYNRLQKIDYTFTPIQKHIYKEKMFVPFVSASYSTLNYVGVGGGVFIKDLGVEYNYLHNTLNKSNGHFFGIKYKF